MKCVMCIKKLNYSYTCYINVTIVGVKHATTGYVCTGKIHDEPVYMCGRVQYKCPFCRSHFIDGMKYIHPIVKSHFF